MSRFSKVSFLIEKKSKSSGFFVSDILLSPVQGVIYIPLLLTIHLYVLDKEIDELELRVQLNWRVQVVHMVDNLIAISYFIVLVGSLNC